MLPSAGEVVELSVGHAAYPVRLIDKPYVSADDSEKSTSMPSIEPYEVKVDCKLTKLYRHRSKSCNRWEHCIGS
jgi:hypothetical protein